MKTIGRYLNIKEKKDRQTKRERGEIRFMATDRIRY